jgi:hypothetical protein
MMKTFLTTLTCVALAAFMFGAAFLVIADVVDPCPKRVVGKTTCDQTLPTGYVERYCSSSAASVSQAECEKSVQEVQTQQIPTQSNYAYASETYTSTDVDFATVKCHTYATCKWKDEACIKDADSGSMPNSTTTVLYKAQYCSNGADVPQD